MLVWAGGSRTGAELRRPVARLDQLSYYPLLVERLRALAATGLTARAIAEVINAEGLRPPRRQERFNPDAIRQLMNRLGIRPSRPQPRADDTALGPDQWWLATLAREIGIPQATLFGWLKRGWISGHREPKPPRRWIISADHDELERLRALHHLAHGYHNRRRWTDALPPDHEGNSHDHATRTGHDPH